jgi:hypothetical protein
MDQRYVFGWKVRDFIWQKNQLLELEIETSSYKLKKFINLRFIS